MKQNTRRPCNCNNTKECRLCWLAVNDRRYRVLWGLEAESIFSRKMDCIHLAQPTGNAVGCGTCNGQVLLKVFNCVRHGQCVRDKEVAGMVSCASCKDHKTFDYQNASNVRDVTTVFDAISPSFNPSIIRFRGKIYFTQRKLWRDSFIQLGVLNEDFSPVAFKRLNLTCNTYRHSAFEDSRLFEHNGELYISFTRFSIDAKGYDRITVNYAKLDHTNLSVSEYYSVQLEDRSQLSEKNWGFFSQDGRLYAVHTLNPHYIIEVDGDKAWSKHYEATAYSFPEKMLHRGGAAPIFNPATQEWYSFYHTVEFNDENPTDRRYGLGVYTFDRSFKPRRVTHNPLFFPIPNHRPERTIPHVVFPGGVIDQYGDWVVACGYYDVYSWLISFSKYTVEQQLRPLIPVETGKVVLATK